MPIDGVKRIQPIGFFDEDPVLSELEAEGFSEEVDSGGGEVCVMERRRLDEMGS